MQSSIKLQQPPGHLDAIAGKLKPKNVSLPDLINPSGHPRVKPLFEKKVMGKIVRAGPHFPFGRRTPPREVLIASLRHRALVEMIIAFQSTSANIRGVMKYLRKIDTTAWNTLAPFFRNYAFSEVIADEALALASQAQQSTRTRSSQRITSPLSSTIAQSAPSSLPTHLCKRLLSRIWSLVFFLRLPVRRKMVVAVEGEEDRAKLEAEGAVAAIAIAIAIARPHLRMMRKNLQQIAQTTKGCWQHPRKWDIAVFSKF